MWPKTFLILFLIVTAILSYNFFMKFTPKPDPVSGFIEGSDSIYDNFSAINSLVEETAPNTSSELEQLVNSYGQKANFTLGVGIKNITTGQEYYLNKDLPFTAASLYKLVVMYGIFYEGRNGKLNVSDPTIQSQLDAMISVSSNEAALALADRIGWDRLDDIAKSIGMKNTSMYNPITTTTEDITNLLNLIVTDRALDSTNSTKMKELLLRQQRNDRIPRLLPDIPIAHKTGELDDVLHDAGIVYGPKNTYVITLMTKGIRTEVETKDLMAQLSLDIYNLFEKK
jgi:beta-lactamase class A